MDTDKQSNTNYLWWIAIVFLLMALTFIFDIWGEKREVIKHPLTDPQHFTKEPVRKAKLEPIFIQDGYALRCNDCHDKIEPSNVQKSFFSAHPDVILEHGVNNYCLTCHSRENREMLIDINKKHIPFSQSQKTCLQCHGPIYRDWENGVHGRMNDVWDSSQGEVKRLTCVQCHDPHQPKFQSMHPAPAPRVENYREFLEGMTVKEVSHE